MQEERVEEQEQRTDFARWMAAHARGTLNEVVTAEFTELVETVSQLGAKGKLVIEILVEPAGGGGRTVAISGKTKLGAPVPAPEVGIFYVGKGGSLHRNDPMASRLPGLDGDQG